MRVISEKIQKNNNKKNLIPTVLITIYAVTRANMGEFDSIENPLK